MIPEIDVRTLTAKKISEGALAFSFAPEADLLEIPFVRFEGDVKAELTYRIFEDDSVEVAGKLSFALCGACSRCLKETRADLAGDVSGFFLPGESDGENYGYRFRKIDLTELLRDSLMFALPSRLLCDACTQWENE